MLPLQGFWVYYTEPGAPKKIFACSETVCLGYPSPKCTLANPNCCADNHKADSTLCGERVAGLWIVTPTRPEGACHSSALISANAHQTSTTKYSCLAAESDRSRAWAKMSETPLRRNCLISYQDYHMLF